MISYVIRFITHSYVIMCDDMSSPYVTISRIGHITVTDYSKFTNTDWYQTQKAGLR
jgi:hypothetical protein